MSPFAPLSLQPGEAVGPFRLGVSVFEALRLLRASRNLYFKVNVLWNHELFTHKHSATSPILLKVEPYHMTLFFEAITQRLSLVEVLNPSTMVEYNGNRLQPDSEVSARKALYKLFGPTYAAQKHPSYLDEDVCSYPGVSFSTGSSVIQRVLVYPDLQNEHAPIAQLLKGVTSSISIPSDKSILRSVEVEVTEVTTITLRYGSDEVVDVELGTTSSEDLICCLGAADSKSWRIDGHLMTQSRVTASNPQEDGCYFLNYFTLGLDFLLDAATHICRKVVVHSNIIGEVQFGQYARCPWQIKVESGCIDLFTTRSAVESLLIPNAKNKSPVKTSVEPLELDRTADMEGDLLRGLSTELLTFDRIAIEITQSDSIETVWLW